MMFHVEVRWQYILLPEVFQVKDLFESLWLHPILDPLAIRDAFDV